jgi:hypothetical protein
MGPTRLKDQDRFRLIGLKGVKNKRVCHPVREERVMRSRKILC